MKTIENYSDGRSLENYSHELMVIMQHVIDFDDFGLIPIRANDGFDEYTFWYPKIGEFYFRCGICKGKEGSGIRVEGSRCERYNNLNNIMLFIKCFSISIDDLMWINPGEFESIIYREPSWPV